MGEAPEVNAIEKEFFLLLGELGYAGGEDVVEAVFCVDDVEDDQKAAVIERLNRLIHDHPKLVLYEED